MKQVRFELEELPFSTLARFGLTQEMIEDLPMRVLEDLCKGRHPSVSATKMESRSRVAPASSLSAGTMDSRT